MDSPEGVTILAAAVFDDENHVLAFADLDAAREKNGQIIAGIPDAEDALSRRILL